MLRILAKAYSPSFAVSEPFVAETCSRTSTSGAKSSSVPTFFRPIVTLLPVMAETGAQLFICPEERVAVPREPVP